MKWWIKFIGSFLLILLTVITVFVFTAAGKPYSDAEQKAITLTQDEGQLTDVEEAYVFPGTPEMVTVIGRDPDGNRMAVFVGQGIEAEPFPLEGAVTEQQAQEAALEEVGNAELLHVKLGLTGGNPVWEVVYLGEDEQLNYVYISAEDGTWRKRILNL